MFFFFFQQSSTSAPGKAFSWLAHVNQSSPKKNINFTMVFYRTALVDWTVHIIKPINKLLMLDTQLLYSHLTSANSQALTSNISFSVHTLERGPTSLKIGWILLSYSSPSKKLSVISLETAAPIFFRWLQHERRDNSCVTHVLLSLIILYKTLKTWNRKKKHLFENCMVLNHGMRFHAFWKSYQKSNSKST